MKLLFLDIDGVLNKHKTLPGLPYCGIDPRNVEVLNSLLLAHPDMKIVISSSWRYMIYRNEMTLRGFEMMLQICGVQCRGRIIGKTAPDDIVEKEPSHWNKELWEELGLKLRPKQIEDWVQHWGSMRNEWPQAIIIFDDLPLVFNSSELQACFVQTESWQGLTRVEVDRANEIIECCLGNRTWQSLKPLRG